MNQPAVTYLDDAHRYLYQDLELDVLLDRFSEDKRDGLHAEITINTSLQPKPGLLFHGRVNLTAAVSRDKVAKLLQERTSPGWHEDTDFSAIITHVCFQSQNRWREGEPSIDLFHVDLDSRPKWLLEPYVEQGGASILFADGGTSKSTIALAMSLSVASGTALLGILHSERVPVMYLDWEADEYTHAERLLAMVGAYNIEESHPIHYRHQVASLTESAAAIRKEIAAYGVGFVVIDSLGAARGNEPESAESTIKLFTAARSLRVPWLGIDHITKSGDKDKPFGSVYTHNMARRTWAMEKVQEEGTDSIVVSLTNRKANNGRLARREAYRLAYENVGDRLVSVTIEAKDILTVPEFEKSAPLKTRILAQLKSGSQSMEVLAETLDTPLSQVRARMSELSGSRAIIKVGNEWGLQHREHDAHR